MHSCQPESGHDAGCGLRALTLPKPVANYCVPPDPNVEMGP